MLSFAPPPPVALNKLKHRSLIFLILCSVAMGLGCGKRKPPTPPKEHVLQRVELSGYQRGDQIILTWTMPRRNAPKGNLLNISRADIYRLAEPITAPQRLSEEEFANRSTLIASVALSDADFGMKTLSYRDRLEFAGQPARLRYAMRFVNSSGQRAAFSNSLLIEPSPTVAGTPRSLSAEASQDRIRLTWQPPEGNIDPSTRVNILGYNIYRSASDKEPAKRLNSSPVASTSFDDEFFDFGKDYYYFVRAVSLGTASEPLESGESNILKFKPVDVFPPSAPSAVTIAAVPGKISIFFAVNPEKDISGYRIYRSTDTKMPKSDWTLLTPDLLRTNTFQDKKVESGRVYYYYVTAADKFGNVSEPSEIVTETVP